ncbi:MAG TPA: 16S rRNA (guanine(966)-N(2))-methyltransferase RsmD [Actinomycetota bacterium]|nr:16S rRNA (guanine(966)-N(2))-methyltransferase RsmD [Actinomycetota bacterium]
MRVIAGTAKGTRLGAVPAGVRPVSDMAREGLFASLGGHVEGARWLDLFAGTGAVGIEALSRGASEAVFVERSRAALALIRANLERTRLAGRATVIGAEVGRFLQGGRRDAEPFDIASLDPPYELGDPALSGYLAAIDAGWLAPEGWTVVLTRGHKGPWPALPVHWAAGRQLRYGDSLLTLYREERWA